MNWLLAHFDTLRESLVRLARQPFATGLNVIVIGIALSLPVGFYLGIDNLQAFSRQLSSDPQVSIFMAMDASQADVSAVERRPRVEEGGPGQGLAGGWRGGTRNCRETSANRGIAGIWAYGADIWNNWPKKPVMSSSTCCRVRTRSSLKRG